MINKLSLTYHSHSIGIYLTCSSVIKYNFLDVFQIRYITWILNFNSDDSGDTFGVTSGVVYGWKAGYA